MSETQSVLDHHLHCFGTLNLDELLTDYTDRSVLMTPDGTLRGPGAIRGFFAQAFEDFKQPGTTFAMKSVQVEADCAFIVWDAETTSTKYEAASDTFVVRDGKIAAQTFAAKVTPKT